VTVMTYAQSDLPAAALVSKCDVYDHLVLKVECGLSFNFECCVKPISIIPLWNLFSQNLNKKLSLCRGFCEKGDVGQAYIR